MIRDEFSAPLRVLHCSSGNLYGGVETLLATLARRASAGLRPEYALCFEGRASAELREAGAPVHLLPPVRFRHPWTVWQARRRLRRLLAERPFDVVVCHGCWPLGIFGPVVRRLGPGRRLVFWLHDLAGGTHWVERLAARTPPDLALAGSLCASETIPRLFAGVPRQVFHPPVVPAAVDRAEARAAVRAELAAPPEATVIVLASRLDPLKGHAPLIEALGRLRDRPGWIAWIAGGAQRPAEHAYLKDLRQRARALGIDGRVTFLGHRADVPRLLAAADIHCQPNLRPESFGLAFVEAMHAGIPVVTTRIGAAAEIVDASCGLLVPPADPIALADALATLIDDPDTRRRLGSAGPPRARRLCDPDTAVGRLEMLLRHGGFSSHGLNTD
jgi:glycosyltransferase involved in cell wall biosynthesis